MQDLLPNILAWVYASKYVLLFVGAMFEGPVLMVASGFLVHLGQLALAPVYIALVGGDFVADIAWYLVGYYGARSLVVKYGHFVNLTPEIIERIEVRFRKYQDHILLISKLTMGFGLALATLIVAGILRISLKRYAVLNLVGGLIWTAFLLAVGYFFGNVYTTLAEPFRIAFACVAILLVIGVFKFANSYLLTKEI